MKKAKKKKQMTKASVVAMSVFATPFLLGGAYSAFYFLATVAEYSGMQSWVEVPAQIDHVDKVIRHRNRGIAKNSRSRSTMYKVVARYSYDFEGRIYQGERVSLYTGSDGNADHHNTVYYDLKRHADERRPYHCFVNPKEPEESVLHRDFRWGVSGLHLFYTVVFGGLGTFLIGSSAYYWLKR